MPNNEDISVFGLRWADLFTVTKKPKILTVRATRGTKKINHINSGE